MALQNRGRSDATAFFGALPLTGQLVVGFGAENQLLVSAEGSMTPRVVQLPDGLLTGETPQAAVVGSTLFVCGLAVADTKFLSGVILSTSAAAPDHWTEVYHDRFRCNGLTSTASTATFSFEGGRAVEFRSDGGTNRTYDLEADYPVPQAEALFSAAPGGTLVITRNGSVYTTRGERRYGFEELRPERSFAVLPGPGSFEVFSSRPLERSVVEVGTRRVISTPLTGSQDAEIFAAARSRLDASVVLVGHDSGRSYLGRIESDGLTVAELETDAAGRLVDIAEVLPGQFLIAGDDYQLLRLSGDELSPITIDWDDPGTAEVEGRPSDDPSCESLKHDGSVTSPIRRTWRSVEAADGVAWVVGCAATVVRVSFFRDPALAQRVELPGDVRAADETLNRLAAFSGVRVFSPSRAVLVARERRGRPGTSFLIESTPSRSSPRWDELTFMEVRENLAPTRPIARSGLVTHDVVGSRSNLVVMGEYQEAFSGAVVDRLSANQRHVRFGGAILQGIAMNDEGATLLTSSFGRFFLGVP